MALIEVDEGEYAAKSRVTEAMQKLLANPKTRTAVLRAQKELDPSLVIPELDAAEPLRGEISETRDMVKKLQEQIEADRQERAESSRRAELQGRWSAGQRKLRDGGYTDEGLAEVEKFMEEKGIADHEVAAAAFERMHPPQTPVRSVGGNRFDLFNADDRTSDHMKALYANPDDPMALDSIINDTLRQVRGR